MVKFTDQNEPLSIAVVGVGGVTRAMLPALRRRPDLEIRWLVDTDRAAAQSAAPADSAPHLVSALADVMADATPDAVVINTPADAHDELAELSLRRGCHTLVAKPLTATVEKAVELAELAAEHRCTLSVGQQMRYNRHYRAVARYLQSGALGQVESVFLLNSKPRPLPANLANALDPALLEMSCHHFDSLASLLGERVPEWIFCDAYKPSWSAYRANSMINALAGYEGGPRLIYHGGFDARAPMYELRLEGSDGSLRCRGRHMSLPLMTYEVAPPNGEYALVDLEDDLPDQATDPWELFLDAWLDYVTQAGPEPPFSARSNIKILATLEAAQRSSKCSTRTRVALPYPSEPSVRTNQSAAPSR